MTSPRLRICFLASAFVGSVPALDVGEPTKTQAAIERGLDFLVKDAAKWRKERDCATCHHGTMTLWALHEAKIQGFKVDPKVLTDITTWTKERLKNIDKPRDTRPGWNMVNSPAVYLSNMALAVPKQDSISADELKKIAGHLVRHQEEDGSFAWSIAPAKNRPPPFFESDEIVTLLAAMALAAQAPKGDVKSAERDAHAKAAAWLAKQKPSETTQAAAFRLLGKVRAGELRQPDIDAFVKLQNKDGGWSQLKELPSDAYATGQALYVLGLAGVKNDHAAIARGVAFLVANQQENGAWPMKSRAHPGAEPYTNPVPITYFGSAWATLGLMRSAPAKN